MGKTSMVATARTVGPMRAAAGLSAFRTVSPMRAAAGLSATRMASPMRAAAGLTATRMMGAPRGVDLDLGQFDICDITRVDRGNVDDMQNVAVGKYFWTNIDHGSNELFTEEDTCVLQAVFDPSVCDRRSEGDLF